MPAKPRVWHIFAGASLHSPDIDPIKVTIDDEAADALHAGDRQAWALLFAALGVYLDQ